MRRTEKITITDEGRDKGKVFLLTEMPAFIGDRWATQVMCLLEAAGATIPDGAKDAGMAGLAAVGLNSGVRTLRALQDPTLDGMWEYVQYVHKPNAIPQALSFDVNSPVEEIRTITTLRMAMVRLHTGFFSAENPSTSEPPSSKTRRG